MSVFRRLTIIAAIAVVGLAGQTQVFAQQVSRAFTAEQYKKALWMTTRFYGAQRSGEGPNWLIMEHTNPAYRTSYTGDKDPDNNRDLSGGWFDCGDHNLYGHTFFFSAYMLALAYESFPTGFHDLYNGKDYNDYMASGDWSINGGQPNGIPDILEELKYATDWIIKATPDANTFYQQMGDRRSHHDWSTSGWQSANLQGGQDGNGGSPRPVYKNQADGPMASFAAAALSVMSRIYRKYDTAYADMCLNHAKNAYGFATRNKNSNVGSSASIGNADGAQYQPHKDPATVFAMASAELYLTTNDNSYLSGINKSDIKRHWHVLDYANSHDLAAYAAIRAAEKAGNAADRAEYLDTLRNQFINGYISDVNGEKVTNKGGDWGELRYAGNTAFAVALHSLAAGTMTTQHEQFIHDQVDFILGKNNANRSFVVGFAEKPIGFNGTINDIKLPHHRNVFLVDGNPENKNLPIPERNKYFGYMVGGKRNSMDYFESVTIYQQSEGGIDYNAGLVGALAYIVSKLAPADTSSFTSIAPKRQGASLARSDNGHTITVRPGAVTFRAANGLTISRVDIYNLQGRQVFRGKGGVPEVTWKSAGRPRGMYMVKMALSDGSSVKRHLLLK